MGASFSQWARWATPGEDPPLLVDGTAEGPAAVAPGSTVATGSSMISGAHTVIINGGQFTLGTLQESSSPYHVVLDTVLKFLSSFNYRSILLVNLDKRTKGTGTWLIRSDFFCLWLETPGAIIWGTGMPGAGKTVLAAVAIEHVERLAINNGDVCVGFVFCRYTERTPVRDILAALVRQLVERRPYLLSLIEPLYARHRQENTKPTQHELLEVLNDISRLFKMCYFFVDGLDEAAPDAQFDILEAFSLIKANFMVTSRPLILLKNVVPQATFFDIAAMSDDLSLFIRERIDRSPALRSLLGKGNLSAEVTRRVILRSGGMFLHASFQMEAIRFCTSAEAVLEALSGSSVNVDDLYRQTMERIQEQPSSYSSLAKRALLWMIYCKEPLSLDQLRAAVSITSQSFSLSPEPLCDAHILISACCGLLVSEESSVQLVHYTAQEKLPSFLETEFPDPHLILLNACLYQLRRALHSNKSAWMFASRIGHVLKQIGCEEHPFLLYAYYNWDYHFARCPRPANTLMVDFLKDFCTFPINLSVSAKDNFIHGPALYSLDFLPSSLHFIAWYGLHPSGLLTPGVTGINERTAKGLTPLHLALRRSHACSGDVFQWLIEAEGLDVNALDEYGYPPLTLACMQLYHTPDSPQCLRQFRLLLSHPDTDANAYDSRGLTALLRCFDDPNGDPVAHHLLEDSKTDANVADLGSGKTPLMLAIIRNRPGLFQALLDRPTLRINQVDNNGRPALLHACLLHRTRFIQQLLEVPGIDLAIEDAEGVSPSMVMAALHDVPITRDESGRTIIAHWAIYGAVDFSASSESLLRGAHQKDNLGRTPLMHAAQRGHVQCARVLLGVINAPHINEVDHDGKNALMFALEGLSFQNHASGIVQLLLDSPSTDFRVVDNLDRNWLRTGIISSTLDSVRAVCRSHTWVRDGGEDGRGRQIIHLSWIDGGFFQSRRLYAVPQYSVKVTIESTGRPLVVITSSDSGEELFSSEEIQSTTPWLPSQDLHSAHHPLKFPWRCAWISEQCCKVLDLFEGKLGATEIPF